ncbi:unnamed protein product, partial [Prorocentrum cordatum]
GVDMAFQVPCILIVRPDYTVEDAEPTSIFHGPDDILEPGKRPHVGWVRQRRFENRALDRSSEFHDVLHEAPVEGYDGGADRPDLLAGDGGDLTYLGLLSCWCRCAPLRASGGVFQE